MVDVLIVGGGLAGSLAAWRLIAARPALSVQLLEAGGTLGGNHTWSFHATDLPPAALTWLRPLVVARWPRHRVAFEGQARTIDAEYCSVTSERLHGVIANALGGRLRLGTAADTVTPTEVRCADGTVIAAGVVIDARGAEAVDFPVGWQTFLGQEIECDTPHGVDSPMIMDATVPQTGAFKFVYVLPFSPTRLLVEDTAYADSPGMAVEAARGNIAAYVARQRWPAGRVVREEIGRLPIPLGGDIEQCWRGDLPRLGMRAGLFHPTTGYSLPDAVATADLVAAMNRLTPAGVYLGVRALAETRWRERSFFRLLNRWLFRAARPEARAQVLAQFYTRPADLIARFYGARLSRLDQMRLLTGRPPVPVWRAIAHVLE